MLISVLFTIPKIWRADAYQEMSGYEKGGMHTQWNITQM